MYFVDRDQIEQRLTYIEQSLVEAAHQLERDMQTMQPLISRLAWERIMHLAIESVTDIGSLMIDGFIMRDASSYEDIIDILRDEGVFEQGTGQALYELVKLRRPLVQHYYEMDEQQLAQWIPQIKSVLLRFKQSVELYLQRELA